MQRFLALDRASSGPRLWLLYAVAMAALAVSATKRAIYAPNRYESIERFCSGPGWWAVWAFIVTMYLLAAPVAP